MISETQFGQLRLSQFQPDAGIAWIAGWEFMDHLWVGEKLGFSEWLRLEDEPDVLRSLSIDFADFPAPEATAVLRTLGLPIHPGMSFDTLRALLGEPVREYRFTGDRVTYEFAVGVAPQYDVSCTVLNEGGLTYLVVMSPLPEAEYS